MFEVLGGNELKELKKSLSARAGQYETLEGITIWARFIKREQEDGLLHVQPGGNDKNKLK